MTRTIPTENEIRKALCRDCFYGQVPVRIVVPTGYVGLDTIQGIRIEIAADTAEPYVVPAEGGRLGFDGRRLETLPK